MTFVPNPNFCQEMATQIERLQQAISEVSTDYCGHPADEVEPALQQRVATVGNGASISGNELTLGAQIISSGKRLWLTNDGKLMGED
ncbi:hypothetical protein ITJ38_17535 [Agreia pratensis]|uniref:hypothetical protein n=1 Tax=Agreia pratensis TaxID=150121 RepID=UPI00188A2CEC|nr:hypothetical protein [Agreia pratensis]MBF4636216.1 hypothetical protein [Agreia pratensis]